MLPRKQISRTLSQAAAFPLDPYAEAASNVQPRQQCLKFEASAGPRKQYLDEKRQQSGVARGIAIDSIRTKENLPKLRELTGSSLFTLSHHPLLEPWCRGRQTNLATLILTSDVLREAFIEFESRCCLGRRVRVSSQVRLHWIVVVLIHGFEFSRTIHARGKGWQARLEGGGSMALDGPGI
jgi:hypothetical protein